MRFIALLYFLLLGFISGAQVLTPAKWQTASSKEIIQIGEEIELIFNATIDNNWYLYSSEFDCEDGPIKTTFSFIPDNSYQLVGKIKAINPIDKHDKIFECDLKIFKKTAEFRQRIKVLSYNPKIVGEYEYQVCTDLTGQCVPGNEEFVFENIKVERSNSKTQRLQEQTNNLQLPTISQISDSANLTTQEPESNTLTTGPILDPSLVKEETKGKSLWGFFLLSFFAGLAALLTPCVFPMIPMTVTFFMKNKKRSIALREALIYAFSILGIYVLEPVFTEMEQLSSNTSPIGKIEQLNHTINTVFKQARAEMKAAH